jgi:hypothetical protein
MLFYTSQKKNTNILEDTQELILNHVVFVMNTNKVFFFLYYITEHHDQVGSILAYIWEVQLSNVGLETNEPDCGLA